MNSEQVNFWRERLSVAWKYRHRDMEMFNRKWIKTCIKRLRAWLQYSEQHPDGSCIIHPALYIDKDIKSMEEYYKSIIRKLWNKRSDNKYRYRIKKAVEELKDMKMRECLFDNQPYIEDNK